MSGVAHSAQEEGRAEKSFKSSSIQRPMPRVTC